MKSFTLYGWLVCAWVLTVSFQYGYHISALNQLQDVLTCRRIDASASTPVHYGLPTCIPMSDATFSLVTSLFTVGGLCGSLLANIAMDRHGRKGATRISSVCNAVGALLSAMAASVTAIAVGRFVVGLAAGIGVCVGPIYLAEIAHPNIRGNIGVGTQLAIVIGIMVTQAMGFGLATPKHWRLVLFISAALSVIQFFMSPVITESPVFLKRIGLPEQQKRALQRLWRDYIHQDSEELGEQPLLANEERPRPVMEDRATVTLPQLLRTPELRRALFIAVFAMTSQQLSGINAVLYYSNAILSRALPALAPYVSLAITVVNFLMTFPPIFLIERLGRKQLMQLSVAGAILSHLAVGYGLDAGMVSISSIAITVFVMSFAIGLGPVPFVIIPEVAPSHASSSISSVALSVNWIMNFVVGLVFLPLRNLLANGNPTKEGRVFYVFAGALLCSSFAFSKFYRR
ncbi:general substrate transporter [Pisolithus marmoratus]|nr:general substrate transporter [Pisolithus marmoratus]